VEEVVETKASRFVFDEPNDDLFPEFAEAI